MFLLYVYYNLYIFNCFISSDKRSQGFIYAEKYTFLPAIRAYRLGIKTIKRFMATDGSHIYFQRLKIPPDSAISSSLYSVPR